PTAIASSWRRETPASPSSDSIIGRVSSAWGRGASSLRSSTEPLCSSAAEQLSVEVSIAINVDMASSYRTRRAHGRRRVPIDPARQIHQHSYHGEQRDRAHQQRVLLAHDESIEQ